MFCSALQCVLQCVAERIAVDVAECCSVHLLFSALATNDQMSDRFAVCCSVLQIVWQCFAVGCSVLQCVQCGAECVAGCCSTHLLLSALVISDTVSGRFAVYCSVLCCSVCCSVW